MKKFFNLIDINNKNRRRIIANYLAIETHCLKNWGLEERENENDIGFYVPGKKIKFLTLGGMHNAEFMVLKLSDYMKDYIHQLPKMSKLIKNNKSTRIYDYITDVESNTVKEAIDELIPFICEKRNIKSIAFFAGKF